MDIKVYIAQFNNGEGYAEDFSEWIDDRVYMSRERCIQSILDKGYKYNRYCPYFESEVYTLTDDTPWPDYVAMIKELDITLDIESTLKKD